ncbi:MAG TPA: hypothetical protein VK737_07020, partial [Opitutales bacterium]|nr:hypothetical protein [Opitutales bacterium]
MADKSVRARAEKLATPDGYAEVRLGMRLHPKQTAMLRDIFKPRSRVVIRCANEVGKTRRVLTAAILYAVEILDCVVVSTAGVWRQIEGQLIPSLNSYAHLFDPNKWQFQATGIKRYDAKNKNWVDAYHGVSTKNEHYFQGYHKDADRPLFIAIDECQGVSPEICKAAEDRCNPTFFAAIGSPGDPQGSFYEMETSAARHYTHHKLTRMECLAEDGYWLDRADIQRLIDKHGEDNPFVQSTVFGNFSQTVQDAIMSLGEYDRMLENQPVFNSMNGQQHGFCDFAAGRDKNVFAHRLGNRVTLKHKWVERDTMAAVGRFVGLFVDTRKETGLRDVEISGDADGLGLPMYHRIRELGWSINEFHGGSEERFGNGYRNKISEVWGEGVKKLKACQYIWPSDPDLKAQIVGRKAKWNSSGQLEVERKEDYKKRVGSSPDEADA